MRGGLSIGALLSNPYLLLSVSSELVVLNVIWCMKIKSDRISHRDQKNSFLILVDDNQKKVICRLIISQNKSKIEINGSEFELHGLDSVVNLKNKLTESAMKFFS